MRILLFISILFFTRIAFTQDSRWVDLDWEPVTGAKDYEIELFQEEEGRLLPRGKYKTESAQWSHAVPPGTYSLRLRSVDKRGVPGEWSETLPLKVRMQNPVLLRPVPQEKVIDPLVTFEWGTVKDAYQYQLVVKNKNNEVIHNALTQETKTSVYVENLGKILWTVLALEKNEEAREVKELPETMFRALQRVGTVLDAPVVSLSLNEKVSVSWRKVQFAKVYEVDYLPPPGSGQKNRRFRLQKPPFVFSSSKLSEGITTITVRAITQGYGDSRKSVIKISKSGSNTQLEDIVQGKENDEEKIDPTRTFFRNELFGAITLSKYTYEGKDKTTDTSLNQKSLTGLGLFIEWNRRPTLNSLTQKLEASIVHLSSGVDSGIASRLAYTWNRERQMNKNKFIYGAGLSYLGLPGFFGDRFANKISVKSTSSMGPELHTAYVVPLSKVWDIHSGLNLAYHPLIVSSDLDGAKPFPWVKVYGRVQRYFTEKQAFFGQIDYQTWSQKWSDHSSTLSGASFNLGYKSTF